VLQPPLFTLTRVFVTEPLGCAQTAQPNRSVVVHRVPAAVPIIDGKVHYYLEFCAGETEILAEARFDAVVRNHTEFQVALRLPRPEAVFTNADFFASSFEIRFLVYNVLPLRGL